MKYSPLQLKRCFFPRVEIFSPPELKDDDSAISVEVEASSFESKEEKSWFVSLEIELKDAEAGGKTPPYLGRIEVFGSFSVSPEWPQEHTEKLVYVNGAGLLYAAAREMICSITARGFFGMYTLPGCSFLELYKEFSERRAAERKSTSATAQPQPSAQSQPSI